MATTFMTDQPVVAGEIEILPSADLGYFRAVALDYDGTIAEDGRPNEIVFEMIGEARKVGLKIVLVTGRILAELEADFPQVRGHFDAIVAENGGVVCVGRSTHRLADPVDERLVAALRSRGVQLRTGEILLACDAVYDHVVLEEIRSLGLDYQLVHNRGALMVLPPGISKGVGLFDALGELGISHHNTIGVGDAENDHALLSTCELGIAVADAVGALKAHADAVLAEPNGAGVAALLRDCVRGSLRFGPSRRWRVPLGVAPDGSEVSVPASQLNVLVTGPPGEGKSFFTGLLAERLIAQGYTVLVADPEGDHIGLGRLRGVVVVSPEHGLPPPDQLPRVIHHRFGSVVVDLSGMPAADRAAYLQRLPEVIEKERQASGLPHWLILDEAHVPLAADAPGRGAFQSGAHGLCLVTYQPIMVVPEALAAVDAVVVFPGDSDSSVAAGQLASAIAGLPIGTIAGMLAGAHRGEALLARRSHLGPSTLFVPSGRVTRHVRHWHKYRAQSVMPGREFDFRASSHEPVTARAANMTQFCAALADCSGRVIRHHAGNGDFSRWVASVIQDGALARALRAQEEAVRLEGDVEQARAVMLASVRERYLS